MQDLEKPSTVIMLYNLLCVEKKKEWKTTRRWLAALGLDLSIIFRKRKDESNVFFYSEKLGRVRPTSALGTRSACQTISLIFLQVQKYQNNGVNWPFNWPRNHLVHVCLTGFIAQHPQPVKTIFIKTAYPSHNPPMFASHHFPGKGPFLHKPT